MFYKVKHEGTGPEFQAMKFNGLETAFEKAKEFLGDSLGGEQFNEMRSTPHIKEQFCEPGDWIVRDNCNDFWTYSPDFFNSLYVIIKKIK